NNTRPISTSDNSTNAPASQAITAESLLDNLPLTPDRLKVSNDSLKQAMYSLGLTYLNEMEDYVSAIDMLEQVRKRFADQTNNDELLFHLYYAYLKAGRNDEAAAIKKQLQEKGSASRF